MNDKKEEVNWMDEARQIAAQCWCDESNAGKEMDANLCESVAKVIAAWMDTAAQNQRNTDYYRKLVEECGEIIGDDAYTADDGTKSVDVLCAKIPALVQKALKMLDGESTGGAPEKVEPEPVERLFIGGVSDGRFVKTLNGDSHVEVAVPDAVQSKPHFTCQRSKYNLKVIGGCEVWVEESLCDDQVMEALCSTYHANHEQLR